MIVVDTNVISELWKIEPNPKVLAWVDAQAVETLYLSVITVTELRYGIAAMSEGKRRTVYQQRLENELLPVFAGRVLAFDLDTSRAWSDLMERAKAAGKAIGKADGYIAATAAVHGLAVATRDTSRFQAVELDTIDPWEAA